MPDHLSYLPDENLMEYEPGAPSSLDISDFSAYRPIRPLPKRKRATLDFSDFPEELYEELQHLPMDAAFMNSLPSMFASSAIDPNNTEPFFPLFNGSQTDVFNSAEDESLRTPPTMNGGGGGHSDEEDRGDGDYVDHLQNPANSKKRKVPVARRADGGSPTGRDDGESVTGTGGSDRAGEADAAKPTTPVRSRSSRTVLVSERLEEKLKVRRRQLESVIPPDADPLTVDLALAQLSMSAGQRGVDAPVSKRRALPKPPETQNATARQALADKTPPSNELARSAFPQQDFTFECLSPISDRYVFVRREIDKLQGKFEEELNRQAAKAAEEASKLAAIVASHQAAAAKGLARDTRSRKRPLANQPPVFPGGAESGGLSKQKGGKKKKRSAIANASNPHHFRNYVPSRLPYSGHPSGVPANSASLNLSFGPLPVDFLTAQLPPRHGKPADVAHDAASAVPPSDEWICPFCDYQLFYAEDAVFRKAVRRRKRILRRRRRARERAAAAAGTAAAPGSSADATPATYSEETTTEPERSDAGVLATGVPHARREGAG